MTKNQHDQDGPSDGVSTRPYLIRALHEWCTDQGLTPYLAVQVDALVEVPLEYVKNDEIVLNVSVDATSHLRLGNDEVSFQARFGGVARSIRVPIDHVVAIYARENGQGMAFPTPRATHPGEQALNQPRTGPTAVPALAASQSSDSSPMVDGEAAAATDRCATDSDGADLESSDDPKPTGPAPGRPSLKRVK